MRDTNKMDWIYRLTENDAYPNPLEEIDALCELSERGEPIFLMLSSAKFPPMSAASQGDVIGLCTSVDKNLFLHAIAEVGAGSITAEIPSNVAAIYGSMPGSQFLPLNSVVRRKSHVLPPSVLKSEAQKTFLSGQAYAKRLTNRSRRVTSRSLPTSDRGNVVCTPLPDFGSIDIVSSAEPFTAIGLDPTAGTWESQMSTGPKEMPSFTLQWNGKEITVPGNPCVLHTTNCSFFQLAAERRASVICIDGPNATNGLQLHCDLSGWQDSSKSGSRDGELALSREGIHLFWTTRNTIRNFDGASRWIARSLVLFNAPSKASKIETHPHGAFTMLSKALADGFRLPKKSTPQGQQARYLVLNAFIPKLERDMVPNHDAMDAACASLVACLHKMNLTVSFGSTNGGGKIWMPNPASSIFKKATELTANV